MPCDALFQKTEPVMKRRGIHLDLKGLAPAPERLAGLLRVFAAARYTTLLVEWEDMFPWQVNPALRSPTAYTMDEVQAFCTEAAALGLEIIPLVQTLGHMESVLHLQAYAPLRELAHDPYTLNPLAPGAAELVQAMVLEMADALPGIRHFHLGADEAWSLGMHPDTKAFIDAHGTAALFSNHLDPLIEALAARNIRPILWHDMLIEFPDAELKAFAQKADLMVWGYGAHPDETELHYNTKYVRRFHDCGVPLWGATACKGNSGYDSDLPDVAARAANAGHWVDMHGRFGLEGVVATAWSRYSADNLQCEPIDAALDAVLQAGVILHDGQAPVGGIDACREALGELPEGDCFPACRAAMARLQQVRKRGWDAVRLLHQHVALAETSARRRGTLPCSSLRELRLVVQESAQVACAVRDAFAGLVAPCWIDEYLQARLEPFVRELAVLEPVVERLTPPAIWQFENENHPVLSATVGV